MNDEISKRRAFAIIAHPDAGKTTLTEKLLLYGGAIQLAGHVRAKKEGRKTRSDWMKLEQQRGISVSTSAMQFEYEGHILNLLDTPGHEDFSEDTYRTLMAVECAIMLLDAARGVEEQTIKLFRICKERRIPIITMVNKLDRPGLEPFELMDNVEEILGITCSPCQWPLGSGDQFKGLYDLQTNQVHLYERTRGGAYIAPQHMTGLDDPSLGELVGNDLHAKFIEDVQIADEVLPDFDRELFLNCEITPVFFGSALTNFGIELLLKQFIAMAPEPQPVKLENGGSIDPADKQFTAFVFKLQANMNKAHRDRVAFARITSGKFERGMQVHLARTEKQVKLSSPVTFFGQDRSTIDEAWPGDIIGLINPRLYQIGDVLCTGNVPDYHPLPRFAPEAFARIIPQDTGKLKAFKKGLLELSEEGVVQLFNLEDNYPIIGGVGQLQFDVFKFRLEDEYSAECRFEMLPFTTSRWIKKEDIDRISKLMTVFYDRDKAPVLLFESEFRLQFFQNDNPEIELFAHPIR